MKTVRIPSGTYHLGWRHTLPDQAYANVDSWVGFGEFKRSFSLSRTVQLDAFDICTEPVDIAALLDQVADEELDVVEELRRLSDLVDGVLAKSGWRLPTEDELEAAIGGALFAWGDAIPEGSPYEPGEFSLHRETTESGLRLPHDSYRVELVRGAFKMGDGGSAVCGAYPWPVAWLALSPSARVMTELIDDVHIWLEDAVIHPVRVPKQRHWSASSAEQAAGGCKALNNARKFVHFATCSVVNCTNPQASLEQLHR